MKFIKLILITSLLSGCAGIPGKNVKLENYPETSADKIKILDITSTVLNKPIYTTTYDPYLYPEDKIVIIPKEDTLPLQKDYGVSSYVTSVDSSYNFAREISNKFNKVSGSVKNLSGCKVNIFAEVRNPFALFCFVDRYLSVFSLAIIPYYCQQSYQVHATIVSTSDNRILKEYDLKDKVHEVWSSIWALSWFIYEPKFAKTPEYAKRITEETISEVLTRAVLADAVQFSECQKTKIK